MDLLLMFPKQQTSTEAPQDINYMMLESNIKKLMSCGSSVDVHQTSTENQLFDVLGIKSLMYYGSFVDLQDLFLIFFNAPLPTPPIPRGPHNFSQLASRAIDSLKYGFINSLFTFSLHLFLICNY